MSRAAGAARIGPTGDGAATASVAFAWVASVVLAAAIALAPLEALAAAVAAALAGLVLVRPGVSLLAIAFAVPFGDVVRVPFGPGSLTLTPLILACTVAITAARTLVIPAEPRPARSRAEIALWLGVAASLLAHAASAWRAPSLEASIVESARWVELGLAAAVAIRILRVPRPGWRELAAAPPAASRPRAAPRMRSARWLAASLLAAGSAQAAFALWMAYRGIGPEAFAILGGRLVRAHGTFGQPNPFGAYMNLVWPLAAALVVERCLTWTGTTPSAIDSANDRVPWPLAGAAVAALGLCGAALALSWSRGAWLAGAAAGAAMAAVWLIALLLRSPGPSSHDHPGRGRGRGQGQERARRSSRLPAFVVLYVLAVVVVGAAVLDAPIRIPASVGDRLASITAGAAALDVEDAEVDDANFATIERLAHWQAARSMWADAPWLGQGPGHFELAYAEHRLPRWSAPLGHAHNYYLHALAETGIVGLVGHLALLAGLSVVALQAALGARSSFERAIGLGLVGALASACVHSVFDNVWVHEMTVHVGLLTGLAVAARGRG